MHGVHRTSGTQASNSQERLGHGEVGKLLSVVTRPEDSVPAVQFLSFHFIKKRGGQPSWVATRPTAEQPSRQASAGSRLGHEEATTGRSGERAEQQ
jgi:hypothetical protein